MDEETNRVRGFGSRRTRQVDHFLNCKSEFETVQGVADTNLLLDLLI